MQPRAHVLIKPQTPESFLSVYMAGMLAIVELERWGLDIWLRYGILLHGINDNCPATKGHGATAKT